MPDLQDLINQADAEIALGQTEVTAALAEGAAVRDQVAALESAIEQLRQIKQRIGTSDAQLKRRDERMRALAKGYGARVAKATEDLAQDGALDATDSDVADEAVDAVETHVGAGKAAGLVAEVKKFDDQTAKLVSDAEAALASKVSDATAKATTSKGAATDLDAVERHLESISDHALAAHREAGRAFAAAKAATADTKYGAVIHLRDFQDAYDRLQKPIKLATGDYKFDVDNIGDTTVGAVKKLTSEWNSKSSAYRTALVEEYEAEIEVAEERIKLAAAKVKAETRKANRFALATEVVRAKAEGP